MTNYNTSKLWNHLLYTGEYTERKIGGRDKKFNYFIDATNYDPEGLLFHIHRNFLNVLDKNGNVEKVSPEAFSQDPEKWFRRAIEGSFMQYIWDKTGSLPFIYKSSTLIANDKKYDESRIEFTKCGLKYIKVQRRSLKKLTPYPMALDIE